MTQGDCWDCGGWDVEWMYHCDKHKGVEFCRGCECPYCREEDGEDEYPEFDEEPIPAQARPE